MDKQVKLLEKLIDNGGRLDYKQFSPEFDGVYWDMDLDDLVSSESPRVDPGWSDIEDCWLEITDRGRDFLKRNHE